MKYVCPMYVVEVRETCSLLVKVSVHNWGWREAIPKRISKEIEKVEERRKERRGRRRRHPAGSKPRLRVKGCQGPNQAESKVPSRFRPSLWNIHGPQDPQEIGKGIV